MVEIVANRTAVDAPKLIDGVEAGAVLRPRRRPHNARGQRAQVLLRELVRLALEHGIARRRRSKRIYSRVEMAVLADTARESRGVNHLLDIHSAGFCRRYRT